VSGKAGRSTGARVETMNKLTMGSAILIATLTACKPAPEGPPRIEDGEEAIACALGGHGEFSPHCRVERSLAGNTLFLTVRHPDGGFRRFEVLKDGGGLAAADGAEPAALSMAGDDLEVAVGLDRYRFPARQMGNVRKP
jgi:hypothetical protein